MTGQLYIHSDIPSDDNVQYFNHSFGGGPMDESEEYYRGIGRAFKVNPKFQRGYGLMAGRFNYSKKRGTGIGSFFQSLWRVAFPMIKTGAKKLGTTALDVATNVAADALQGRNIKESAKEHLTTKGTALLSEIKDKGIDVLKNINPSIEGIIDKSSQPTGQTVSSSAVPLAAPAPEQTSFRRLSRKRAVKRKVSYSTIASKKQRQYPGLQFLK